MSDHYITLLTNIHGEVQATRKQLADLQTVVAVQSNAVQHIEQHLATLNGTVAKHEKRIGDQTMELLSHVGNCAMRADVARIESTMREEHATNRGANVANAKWLKNITPLLWTILGAIATLVLLEARSFLP